MKKLKVIILMTAFVFLSAGCGKEADGKSPFSEFGDCILETVTENYEDGKISREDIAIDRIYCGHFSQRDANEILVLCKIRNTPHAAGLDKTAAVLLEEDSLERIAYKEFNADHVTIDCVQTDIGQSRILFIGTTTYQGISTQEIQLLGIQDSQWLDIPIEELEELSDGYFCFMGDAEIIVSSVTDHSDIVTILKWNPGTGRFSAD